MRARHHLKDLSSTSLKDMRFFRNKDSFEKTTIYTTHQFTNKSGDAGSLTDSSYERRNATYTERSDCEDKENFECVGNEETPIQKLPEEVIRYIFEIGSADITQVYYADDETEDEISLIGMEMVVSRDKWRWTVMSEDDDWKRSSFLYSVSGVCHRWMSIAGPMNYRAVQVDGFQSDYDRAITTLRNDYPGLPSKPKGVSVRDLTIDVKAEYVDQSWNLGEKVTKLLCVCPRVERLVLRGNGAFETTEVEKIWEEGIAGIAPTLVYLEWTSYTNSKKSLGFVRYIAPMRFLTELVLEDDDELYDFTGWESISLPQVHTYRLTAKHSSIMRYQAKWDMRSLNHLELSVGEYEDTEEKHDREAVLEFFEAHGKKLKYLDLKDFASCRNVIQTILDRTPCLDQLAIPIGLLGLNEGIHNNSIRLLCISGFYMSENHRHASVGTYLAMFATTLRQRKPFPRVKVIKIRYTTATELGTMLGTDAIEEWKEWFKVEENRRPVIIDFHNLKVSLHDLIG